MSRSSRSSSDMEPPNRPSQPPPAEPQQVKDEQPQPQAQEKPPKKTYVEEHAHCADRDPSKINHLLKMDFDEIIAEPDLNTHSWDGVWDLSHTVFFYSRLYWYQFLSLICAVPTSICCGVVFACYSFEYIWCCMPAMRLFEIFLLPIRKIFLTLVKAFCVPCYSAIGYTFSKVRVQFNTDGQPPTYEEVV